MEYLYTGIDKNSVKQKGKINANAESDVVEYLRTNNITPLKISKNDKKDEFWIFKKVKQDDIVIFTRQLSSMILTGLTLIEALKILKSQSSSKGLQEVITDLINQISEGSSFSEALESQSEYFSEVYIALIRAAEKGGILDKVLSRLADNLERGEDLKKKVKSALFYPTIVVVAMVAVIVIMNVFVIPQLGGLYESLHVELPLSTKIILGMSKLFTSYWLVLLIIIAGGVFLYTRFKKTQDGIKIIDRVKLHIPVMGNIVTLSILDEISRTLSLLISSGASIIESLNITSNVAGNYWYKQALLSASSMVEKGVPLSDAFAHQNIFPIMIMQMSKVGESTGKIDESLAKVSEYYERDLDIQIKTLTTAIEPILIIFLGVSVAFLTLSVITPIYGLISQIQ